MTPEEARELLDGTTPGPWEWESCKDDDVEYEALRGPGGVNALRTQDAEEYASWVRGTNADKTLAAAAPALATLRAEMREEWGIVWPADKTSPEWIAWGFSTIEDAYEHVRDMTVPEGASNVRIVRRYVTEPEEIK